MISKVKLLASTLAITLVSAGAGVGCNEDSGNERWATTENTNVKIDWDKVNEAYKLAEGPEDLEKRINEIYEGKEIISVAVHDAEDKSQTVTGFFDKNTNGTVEDDEKIFTIKREIAGDGSGNYQTTGYGAYYGGYHSPFLSIATGMLMGSMMSRAFMPGYAPMYSQPYVTSAGRAGQLQSSRSSYRNANPSRFQKSQSGRTYGKSSSRPKSGGGGFRGGVRFGLSRAGRTHRPERLTA